MYKWAIYRKFSPTDVREFEINLELDIMEKFKYYQTFNLTDGFLERAEFGYGEYKKPGKRKYI